MTNWKINSKKNFAAFFSFWRREIPPLDPTLAVREILRWRISKFNIFEINFFRAFTFFCFAYRREKKRILIWRYNKIIPLLKNATQKNRRSQFMEPAQAKNFETKWREWILFFFHTYTNLSIRSNLLPISVPS